MHPSLSCSKNCLLKFTFAPYFRELPSNQRSNAGQKSLEQETEVGGGESLWQPRTAWCGVWGYKPNSLASVWHDSMESFLLQCFLQESGWAWAAVGSTSLPNFFPWAILLPYPLQVSPGRAPSTNPSHKISVSSSASRGRYLRNLPDISTITAMLRIGEIFVVVLLDECRKTFTCPWILCGFLVLYIYLVFGG